MSHRISSVDHLERPDRLRRQRREWWIERAGWAGQLARISHKPDAQAKEIAYSFACASGFISDALSAFSPGW
jgi:hypothetical protein